MPGKQMGDDHYIATGHDRNVNEAELKSFVTAGNAGTPRPQDQPRRRTEVTGAPISARTLQAADEMSLVSTQNLRKAVKASGAKDRSGGFDPYHKG
jgi:hypothetical protein